MDSIKKIHIQGNVMVDFGRSWMDGPHERMDGLHCISEIEMRKLSLVLDFLMITQVHYFWFPKSKLKFSPALTVEQSKLQFTCTL